MFDEKEEKELEQELEKGQESKEENVDINISSKTKIKSKLTGGYSNKFNNLTTKYKKDPKKYLVILSGILVMASALCGTSYAYLTYVSKTESTVTINAGQLALTLENEQNVISIQEAVPISDAEGLAQEQEYSFDVKNNGTIPATYKITLDNTCQTGTNINTCIPDEYIKVGLKVGSNNYKVIERNEKSEYIIETGSLQKQKSQSYKMKIWLDHNTPNTYNAAGDKNIVYKGKLGLSYTQGKNQQSQTPSVVYRYGTNGVSIGTSLEPVTGTKWIIKLNGEENEMLASYVYDTHADCTAFLTQNGITEGQDMSGSTYTCAEKEGTFGGFDYTEDYTTLNKTYFLGHKIGNDGKVERNDAYFIRNNTLYCLKGVETANAGYDENNPAPYYQENYNTLLEAFGPNAIENNVCSVSEDYIDCSASGLGANAYMNGNVNANDDSTGCDAYYNGNSECSE